MTAILTILILASLAHAKQLALTFDDTPMPKSHHYGSEERTQVLIEKLGRLNVKGAMIFANPCRGVDETRTVEQLKRYVDAGHVVANHTCTHPRLSEVGFDFFSADVLRADLLLAPITPGQKFFRYPYLNEGNTLELRDQTRNWLEEQGYRNAYVTLDNDDYMFSFEVNQARILRKKVNYWRVRSLYLKHVLSAVEFYDDFAREVVGRSPKHVILLHEMDMTVRYIEDLVHALRKKGWEIIPATEALEDPIYSFRPRSLYAGNGLIPQIHHDKTGVIRRHGDYDRARSELRRVLGLD